MSRRLRCAADATAQRRCSGSCCTAKTTNALQRPLLQLLQVPTATAKHATATMPMQHVIQGATSTATLLLRWEHRGSRASRARGLSARLHGGPAAFARQRHRGLLPRDQHAIELLPPTRKIYAQQTPGVGSLKGKNSVGRRPHGVNTVGQSLRQREPPASLRAPESQTPSAYSSVHDRSDVSHVLSRSGLDHCGIFLTLTLIKIKPRPLGRGLNFILGGTMR